MKRLVASIVLALLFVAGFITGGEAQSLGVQSIPDSLRSLWLYTEALKQYKIQGDSVRAQKLLREVIALDSTYAPAYYALATNGMYATLEEAVRLAKRAYDLDSTNKWYHQFYGQTLLYASQYREAQGVFKRLCAEEPSDPDNYRILAALYEQNAMPYMALATLDSAEIRFGRIPYLSSMKRRLLVATSQTDKAIAEAEAMVATAPYQAQYHVELADMYAAAGKDSLALESYNAALKIDSTSLPTLMSLADFYTDRHDYRALFQVTRKLYQSEEMPLNLKIKRFELFTADTRFYREYYPQINNLATLLAIQYPNEERIVELYAKHLIASGELQTALTLYKNHLEDQPPVKNYYKAVIDIESYLRHLDSVSHYVNRAIRLFPEDLDFNLAKANALARAGHNDAALNYYKGALRFAQTDSTRSVIWGIIGDTWHLKSEAEKQKSKAAAAMKQAYKAYDKSLRYDKDNTLVLNNYAYFLSVENKELERALVMSSRVAELTDNNPTYMDTYAWILFKLGRTAEAKKLLQQAIALDGQSSPELLVHYGDVLDALGERFLAETYWKKAQEKGYDAAEIERRLQNRPTK